MEQYREKIRRIMISVNVIDGIYDSIAKKTGVKENLLTLLYALDDGAAHSQKEICEEWFIPKTTLNTIVRECVEKGYVTLDADWGRGAGEGGNLRDGITEGGNEEGGNRQDGITEGGNLRDGIMQDRDKRNGKRGYGKGREKEICLTEAGSAFARDILNRVYDLERHAMEKAMPGLSDGFVNELECFTACLKKEEALFGEGGDI